MADTIYSSTAYDDVFRTMVNDCSKLIIPVINEVFGKHYTGEEAILFSPNEHFLNQQDGRETKRITDTSFVIIGESETKYHLECESTLDKSILIRIFEYDAQIALDQDTLLTGNRIQVSFPHTAVLYLRSNTNTPDVMQLVIQTPGGAVSYNIPVMKVVRYTIEEIFEKNLLFLIPFYLFTYEAEFADIEQNETKLASLKSVYQDIKNRLEQLQEAGTVNAFYKQTILDMSGKVVVKLAARYENIRKEIKTIMVGNVLDYEAKRILNEGIEQGIKIGEANLEEETKRADAAEQRANTAEQRADTAEQRADAAEQELARLKKQFGVE